MIGRRTRLDLIRRKLKGNESREEVGQGRSSEDRRDSPVLLLKFSMVGAVPAIELNRGRYSITRRERRALTLAELNLKVGKENCR
jgi:hypothetical protein